MKLPKKLSKLNPLKRFQERNTVKGESRRALRLLSKLWNLKLTKIIIVALAAIVILPAILFFILKPAVNHNVRYGTTFSNKYAEEIGLDWREVYIASLDDLGLERVRLVAYWDDIEENRDQINHDDIWWQLEEAQKRDVDVILTVGRKVPRWPECFEPEWWKEIEEESVRDQELLEHVKRTVKDLKHFDNIKMWQVENEPFFPFGICEYPIKRETVRKEVEVVREIDDRPIIIQDSGEGGYWLPTYRLGDYLAISMYRKIWYDFWGVFLGRSIYFKYPLAHWTYKMKAHVTGVPFDKIIVTELQGEPWGPGINSALTEQDKQQTMSRNDFLDTLSYAQRSGVQEIYVWGVEWWYWEKTQNDNSFYWNTFRELLKGVPMDEIER